MDMWRNSGVVMKIDHAFFYDITAIY